MDVIGGYFKDKKRVEMPQDGPIFEGSYERDGKFRVSCYWHHKVMACSRVRSDVLCNISVTNRLRSLLTPCYTRSASPSIIICDQHGKFFHTLKQTSLLSWHGTPQIFVNIWCFCSIFLTPNKMH
jgi:hypothetical protein